MLRVILYILENDLGKQTLIIIVISLLILALLSFNLTMLTLKPIELILSEQGIIYKTPFETTTILAKDIAKVKIYTGVKAYRYLLVTLTSGNKKWLRISYMNIRESDLQEFLK